MNDAEILKDIKEALNRKFARQQAGTSSGELWSYTMYLIDPTAIQCYLMLSMLDMLERVNSNIMDVETAVQRLDPLHRD